MESMRRGVSRRSKQTGVLEYKRRQVYTRNSMLTGPGWGCPFFLRSDRFHRCVRLLCLSCWSNGCIHVFDLGHSSRLGTQDNLGSTTDYIVEHYVLSCFWGIAMGRGSCGCTCRI